MQIEEVKAKMKEIEKNAAEHPEKKPIYRLKWRALKAACDLYYKKHPQDILPLDK
jgi:hypothetical protein